MFKLKYKLSNGELIDAKAYTTLSLIQIDGMNIDIDVDRHTFEYNGETINADNFEYIPLDKYIDQLDQEEYMASIKVHTLEDFIAMILKESERVGFIVPVDINPFGGAVHALTYEYNVGQLPVLMRPSFKRFPKDHLTSVIELIPASAKFSVINPCQLFTIRDFFDRIELGHIRMVNLDTYYLEGAKSDV